MRSTLRVGCTIVAVCSAGSALWPARSDANTEVQGPAGIQEVVITAEKRTGTVQSTPISVTALSGSDLQAQGAVTLGDVVNEVPGVSQRTAGPGVTEYEMRGLSSSGGSSPTVGFYLDDTPLTAPAGSQWGKVVIDTNLYDVDRLEVLRGPQGTLYGAGSMGGTIKIYTRPARPGQLETSGEIEGSGTQGGGANGRVSGMVNLPAGDLLAVRLVGSALHQSGWIDRVVLADFPGQPDAATRGELTGQPVLARHADVNSYNQQNVRLSATYKPTDRLSIVPTLLYQHMTAGGLATVDNPPGNEAHYQPYDISEPIEDRTRLASLVVKYSLDAFDTVLALSDWKRDLRLVQDQSEADSVLLSTILGAIPPGAYDPPDGVGPSNIHEDNFLSQFAAELRLVSSGTGPFQWVTGLYFSRFHNEWNVNSQVPGSAALFGTANEITWAQPQTVRQTAVFGDVSYKLRDNLKLTLGGRAFHYDSDLTTTTAGWVTITGSDETYSQPASAKESGFTPKVNLSWQPSADLTVFGTVAKGFRPGGGNAPLPLSGPSDCTPFLQALGIQQAPTFYHSDNVISYELGEKWRLLDRRVTVNASAYRINWNKVQQTVVLGCGYPFTGNEGKATVNGLELEGNYVLGGGLDAMTSVAYTKAQLSEDVPATGGHKGDPLQNTPQWTAAAALIYTADLGQDRKLLARVGGSYVGSRVDATYAINELPGYFLADGRLTFSSGRWSTALFVDNIANKRAIINNVTSLSFNLESYNRVAVSRPRTIGLNVSVAAF